MIIDNHKFIQFMMGPCIFVKQPKTIIKIVKLSNIIQNNSIEHVIMNSHQLRLKRNDQHDGIFQVLT